MDRVTLEKAWLDCYDYENLPVSKRVELITKRPATKMATEVYNASLELRSDGINWFGSDFEDELVDIIKKGDLAIDNPDVHITVEEYEDLKKAKKEAVKKEKIKMANLTIKDIINNTINQLQEAKAIIEEHGGEAGMSMAEEELCEDILTSVDRLSSIENIIHFALCAAVYAGHIEATHKGFCSINCADSIDNLNAYLEIAEQYDPIYTKDGRISIEDMYSDISDMVHKKYQREGMVGEFAYSCDAWCQIMGKRYVNGEPEYKLYGRTGWTPQHFIKDFRAKGDF